MFRLNFYFNLHQTLSTKWFRLAVFGVFIFLGTSTRAAAPAPAAATVCTACHGPNGWSNNPLWPNLAGQKKDYLLKALKDFREGRRVDPLMSPVSKTLLDSDLEPLAQFFSTQQGAK